MSRPSSIVHHPSFAERTGFALLAVVFIMLSLAILGLMLAGTYSPSAKVAVENLNLYKAQILADAGMRWVLENQFKTPGDIDFSNNVPPTDPPFGPNAVTLGDGQFWVEYGPTQTQTTIDLRVTARVGNAVRRVRSQLRLTRVSPMRRAIYAVNHIDLGLAANNPSTPTGITGDITSEWQFSVPPSIRLPPSSQLTFNGALTPNALYRFQGIDRTLLDDPANRNETINSVALGGALTATFYPMGQDTDGLPPTQNPDGTYGDPNGYLWWTDSTVEGVVLDGGSAGGGTIRINGTIIRPTDIGYVSARRDPIVIWTAPDKDISLPRDGVLDKLPVFDVLSATFRDDGTLSPLLTTTIHGAAVVRNVLECNGTQNFTLNGLLLSQGSVQTTVSSVYLTMTYDSQWSDPYASIPWMPGLEYQLNQWREEISP